MRLNAPGQRYIDVCRVAVRVLGFTSQQHHPGASTHRRCCAIYRKAARVVDPASGDGTAESASREGAESKGSGGRRTATDQTAEGARAAIPGSKSAEQKAAPATPAQQTEDIVRRRAGKLSKDRSALILWALPSQSHAEQLSNWAERGRLTNVERLEAATLIIAALNSAEMLRREAYTWRSPVRVVRKLTGWWRSMHS